MLALLRLPARATACGTALCAAAARLLRWQLPLSVRGGEWRPHRRLRATARSKLSDPNSSSCSCSCSWGLRSLRGVHTRMPMSALGLAGGQVPNDERACLGAIHSFMAMPHVACSASSRRPARAAACALRARRHRPLWILPSPSSSSSTPAPFTAVPPY